jgi:hypothetical protein
MNEIKYLFYAVIALIVASVVISVTTEVREPEIVKAFTYGITAGIGGLAMAIKSKGSDD